MFEAHDNIQSYMAKINHTSSQAERAEAMLAERGMVRLREFTAAGIAEETLARLARPPIRAARASSRRTATPPAQAAALRATRELFGPDWTLGDGGGPSSSASARPVVRVRGPASPLPR